MRVVIGDRFRRWSSSSIAFRRWVTGILLVTHDSSVRPSPHSPRNRRQFLAREASAAVGGFVHPQITSRLSRVALPPGWRDAGNRAPKRLAPRSQVAVQGTSFASRRYSVTHSIP